MYTAHLWCVVYVQRNCKVVWDRCNDRERQLVGWLWEALQGFSAAERRLFLRVVSGRSRVPQGWTLGSSAGSDAFPTRKFELHIMRCIIHNTECVQGSLLQSKNKEQMQIIERVALGGTPTHVASCSVHAFTDLVAVCRCRQHI